MAAASTFNITISAVDKATASIRKIKASVANATKPATDLKASFAALGKEAGLDRVAKSVKSIGNAAQGAARQFASMVPALATISGIASAAGIAALATEFGKAGAEIKRTSAVIGVSTGDLQAYRGAAKLAGLSADDMTGSLKTLGTTIEDATFGRNQDALVMMHKFGIRLQKTKDGAVDATRALKEVANAIVAQKGNVQAQSLIARSFGVEALLPMLQKGEVGIDALVDKARKFGLVMSGAQLDKGERFNENLLKLEASATRLKNSFGDAMAPAVERVIDVVGRLVDKYGQVAATKVAEYVERFANWLDHVDWEKTADSVSKFVDSIGGVKGVAIAIAAISFAGPIAGVLGLISNLALLTTATIPAALGSLGALGTAAVAALAAWGGLKLAKAAGLPDTDKNKGAADVKAGNWWAASASLPALDFLNASIDRLSGKSNSEISYGLGGGGKSTVESKDLFSKLESQYGLPVGLLDSVWNTESSRGQKMNSPAGAKGHFQFMDGTARQYGVADPYDLKQSATGAAKYYSDLLKANGGDLDKALAAYNWGPGNLSSKGLQNAPKETRDYIAKVRSGLGNGSLYGGTSAAIASANQPGGSSVAGGDSGKVQVEVVFANAPAGMKTSVKTSGNVTATARVSSANVTGPSV